LLRDCDKKVCFCVFSEVEDAEREQQQNQFLTLTMTLLSKHFEYITFSDTQNIWTH